MKAKKDQRATLKIDPELHRRIKTICAATGEKMEDFVDRALRSEVRHKTIDIQASIALKG